MYKEDGLSENKKERGEDYPVQTITNQKII
jgi:hypothetical protein